MNVECELKSTKIYFLEEQRLLAMQGALSIYFDTYECMSPLPLLPEEHQGPVLWTICLRLGVDSVSICIP